MRQGALRKQNAAAIVPLTPALMAEALLSGPRLGLARGQRLGSKSLGGQSIPASRRRGVRAAPRSRAAAVTTARLDPVAVGCAVRCGLICFLASQT